MKIGMLGTGTVGTTLATALIEKGHEVRMGAREASNPKALAWAKQAGPKASVGTFRDAASFGELNFNCTLGSASLEALKAAGSEALGSKILVDTANPLDFSKGMPPSLLSEKNDSLGEQIQRAHPKCRVVKALNTVNAALMVAPRSLKDAEHDLLICGDDSAAKAKVTELLREFGWKHLVDVGGLSAARGTEAWLLLWVRLYGTFQTPNFNLHLVR